MNSINFETEKQYSPSQWCSRHRRSDKVEQNHIENVTKLSQDVKNKFQCESNVRYGKRSQQLLDIFEPKFANAPTFVYIHGGYWQTLNKDISCYSVTPLLNAGIRVVIPGYDLAPSVSLDTIMTEMEELVEFLLEIGNARNWSSLWLGGHSAGAHLAASILCCNLRFSISGFILISGIYDLRPLINTSFNAALKLNDNSAKKLSPIFKFSTVLGAPFNNKILLVMGEFESPAFLEQQQRFAQEFIKIGLKIKTEIISNADHFQIVEWLNDENYSLTKIIIEMIRAES